MAFRERVHDPPELARGPKSPSPRADTTGDGSVAASFLSPSGLRRGGEQGGTVIGMADRNTGNVKASRDEYADPGTRA